MWVPVEGCGKACGPRRCSWVHPADIGVAVLAQSKGPLARGARGQETPRARVRAGQLRAKLSRGLSCPLTIESQNRRIIGWERPLSSSSPTIHPTPPCLLNHVLKCHIYTVFKILQPLHVAYGQHLHVCSDAGITSSSGHPQAPHGALTTRRTWRGWSVSTEGQ